MSEHEHTAVQMSDLGQQTLEQNLTAPFAVEFNRKVVLFANLDTAHTYSSLLEYSGLNVRRFVAISEPEYTPNTEISGWRAVAWFMRGE